MSGNVINTEFDDVLSSIRRLVSDNSSEDAETVNRDNDRFVLTPALRVLDDLSPIVDADDVTDLEFISGREEAPEPLQLGEAVVEVEEPKAPQSPEFTAMAEAWTEELARVSSDQEEPGEDGQMEVLPRPDVSLEMRIAELEEAVSQTADEWEPDGIEPEVVNPPRHHIFEVVDNTKAPEAELVAQDEQDETDDLDRELDEIASEADNDLVEDEGEEEEAAEDEEVEELDGAVESSDNVTPMFTHSTERSGEPYLLSQIVPNTGENRSSDPDKNPEFRHVSPVEAEPATPASAIVDNDDVFLDVEALRSMISDVVREELRGNMGESITRNLRRMVRQEIEVALLPKDPE